jgi:hypothetical protein
MVVVPRDMDSHFALLANGLNQTTKDLRGALAFGDAAQAAVRQIPADPVGGQAGPSGLASDLVIRSPLSSDNSREFQDGQFRISHMLNVIYDNPHF